MNCRFRVMTFQTRLKDRIKPLIFPLAPVPRTVRFGPAKGVSLYLSRVDGIQRELGLYETELSRFFRRAAAQSAVMLDIGASEGYTSLLLAGLAPEGARVISFEPDPSALGHLRRNIDLNPAAGGRIHVLPVAVGATCSGQSAYVPEQVAIDDLVREARIPPPDFIKIDVDGGEAAVLAGTAETLTTHRPVVIVETHSIDLELKCTELLKSAGYDVRIIKNAAWRFLWPELRLVVHNRWLIAQVAP